MQTRYWLATKENIQEAYQLKSDLLHADPERVIQIRKGRDGGKQVFRVVERFQGREAAVITESKRLGKKNRKRGKRVPDLTWANS